MNDVSLHLRVCGGALGIEAAAWDRLVGDGSPFLEHAWLAALERTGSVGPGTGWTPRFVVVERGGHLAGAVPLYLKAHSFGEYVYDWAWCDVSGQLGVPYYPKLVATSPLSPVGGARLLVDAELRAQERERVLDALLAGVTEAEELTGATGTHFLFTDPAEVALLERRGFMTRAAYQYHWRNEGYASFDDYLSRFESKRRREIRRERRRVAELGVRVAPVPGTEMTRADAAAVDRFYRATCTAHVFSRPYLRPGFFDEALATMPGRLLMMRATDSAGATIAGTFNLQKGGRLYGRYWGSDVQVPHLHFETCYYATLEHAIASQWQAMEPGAGGDHKFARGFEPVLTYSAHRMRDPALHALLARHCARERAMVEAEVEALLDASPLRCERTPSTRNRTS